MKKIIPTVLVCLIIAAYSFGAYIVQKGKVLTATSTPTEISAGASVNDYAAVVSLVVTGSETVYVMKDVDAADFVLTNAFPIISGYPYTFREGEIHKVTYATESADSIFVITFE